MAINISSLGLRGIGFIASGFGAFVLEAGQFLGILILGLLSGILIWSIIDLIKPRGIFQDKSTAGINSGVSVLNVILPPVFGGQYIQYILTPVFLLGLVMGIVIAGVWDYGTKTK